MMSLRGSGRRAGAWAFGRRSVGSDGETVTVRSAGLHTLPPVLRDAIPFAVSIPLDTAIDRVACWLLDDLWQSAALADAGPLAKGRCREQARRVVHEAIGDGLLIVSSPEAMAPRPASIHAHM